jgi:hypothetical protein
MEFLSLMDLEANHGGQSLSMREQKLKRSGYLATKVLQLNQPARDY